MHLHPNHPALYLLDLFYTIIVAHVLILAVTFFGVAIGGIDPADASLSSQYVRYLVSFII